MKNDDWKPHRHVVSTAILYLAVCVHDITNKASLGGTIVYYVISLFLLVTGEEQIDTDVSSGA